MENYDSREPNTLPNIYDWVDDFHDKVSRNFCMYIIAEAARAILAFWKTHKCKLISNWTRNRMITYTNALEVRITNFIRDNITMVHLFMLMRVFLILLSQVCGKKADRIEYKWQNKKNK